MSFEFERTRLTSEQIEPDVITQVMSEETDKLGKYNDRGLALDGLIGLVYQWTEEY